jgi:hypothetical protein
MYSSGLYPVKDQAKESISHFILVLDESTSMLKHWAALIKVYNSLIASWAEKSTEFGQQVRVTVYAFNNFNNIRCLCYDTDVLRLPSIESMYSPGGITALIDATIHAINDLNTTPEKYGEHGYVLFVITDGIENDSRVSNNPGQSLKAAISGLAPHWSVCAFVPDQDGKTYLTRFGFPPDNVQLWDTSSSTSLEKMGQTITRATTSYMEGRKSGIRSSTSFFKLNTLSTKDITSLRPLQYFQYRIMEVPADEQINKFVADRTGSYNLGEAYYEFTKPEMIQPQKQIAVMLRSGGAVYTGTGNELRRLLGLPDDHQKVYPENHKEYVLFVQSTSLNRKLKAGTKLLLIPGTKPLIVR